MADSAPSGSPAPKFPAAPKPMVSLLAITSPLSVAAFLVSAAFGLPGYELGTVSAAGVVVGVLALWQIRRSRGRLGGRGLALAGVGLSVLLLGWSAVAFRQERHLARATERIDSVEHDLERLTRACWKYGARRGGELPPADVWRDLFEEEGFLKADAVGGPAGDDEPRSYAMNVLLGGLRPGEIKDRARTVLFFECKPGSPQAGGPGNFRRDVACARDRHSHVIAFADGHCEYRDAPELDDLNWLPQGKLECPMCGQEVRLPVTWTPEQRIACPACDWVLRDPHAPDMTAIWERGSAGLPGG
jgi:hypothetical protein